MRELFSKQKKFYRIWLFSYFAFVVLFIVFALILTAAAKNIVKDEILKTNEATFSTAETNVRMLKNDLDKMGSRISLDKQVMDVVEQKLEQNEFWSYEMLRRGLDVALSNYNTIDSAGIFLKEQDVMVEHDGVIGIKRLYQDYLPQGVLPEDADYAQWKAFMQQRHRQEFYQSARGDILYFQSLPIAAADGNGVLVCKVERSRIFAMFPELSADQERTMLLMDGEKILFDAKPGRFSQRMLGELMALPPGSHVLRDAGAPWVVNVSDELTKPNCILAVSGGAFWRALNLFMGVMAAIAALLALLGLLLAHLFAKRQYTPVENILNLMKRSAQSQEQRGDEFEYIKNSLQTVLQSARESEKQKERYRNITFRSEFVKLLREPVSCSVSGLLERFHIPFAGGACTAVLLSINDISDYFGTIDFDDEQEQELMELAVTNVFEEVMGHEYQMISVKLDQNMIFVLIGTDVDCTRGMLLEKIKQAQSFTKQDVGIYYSALVSETFDTPDDGKKGYLQTMDLYNCHQVLEADVVSYDEMEWAQDPYTFTIDVEKRLVEQIAKGKMTDAKELLDQLFAGQAMQEDASMRIFYMKYDLMSTFMKVVRLANQEKEQAFLKLAGELAAAKTMQELHAVTAGFLGAFQTVFQKRDMPKKDATLGEDVLGYLEQHYADENLSVHSLGDAFGLSPGYLSKLFKQQTGEILRDAIVGIRLGHVEQLLRTGMKLEEVAHACGFIDVGTMIRAFKKRYGVTPGKYRGSL